jgi:hypothetical protein
MSVDYPIYVDGMFVRVQFIQRAFVVWRAVGVWGIDIHSHDGILQPTYSTKSEAMEVLQKLVSKVLIRQLTLLKERTKGQERQQFEDELERILQGADDLHPGLKSEVIHASQDLFTCVPDHQ